MTQTSLPLVAQRKPAKGLTRELLRILTWSSKCLEAGDRKHRILYKI